MKTLLLLFFLLSVSAIAALKTSARLEWDYLDDASAVTFNLYHATNVAGPYAFLTNVATTNVVVPISGGSHFYYVTATNEWGESDPSNIASAKVPGRGQNLRITAQ